MLSNFKFLKSKAFISAREFKTLRGRWLKCMVSIHSARLTGRRNLTNGHPKSLQPRGSSWNSTTTPLEYAIFYFLYQAAGFKLKELFFSAALWLLDGGILLTGSLLWIGKSPQGGCPYSSILLSQWYKYKKLTISEYLDRCVCFPYFTKKGLM